MGVLRSPLGHLVWASLRGTGGDDTKGDSGTRFMCYCCVAFSGTYQERIWSCVWRLHRARRMPDSH